MGMRAVAGRGDSFLPATATHHTDPLQTGTTVEASRISRKRAAHRDAQARAQQNAHRGQLQGQVMDAWTSCDVGGCNARSYVTVTIDTHDILDFCGHCYSEREEALLPYVIKTDDRRATLLKRAHVDA